MKRIDLHLHLDGAISLSSARDLGDLLQMELPKSDDELLRLLQVSPDCRDLNEFLEKFAFPCSLLKRREGLERAVRNLLKELKDQNVCYAEIRFAPQLSEGEGLSQKEAVEAALNGMEGSAVKAQLILCCMRGEHTHEANLATVRLVKEFIGKGVCAVDLAGAEALFPTEDFAEEFALARELGVPITIHAGEAAGPESVWKALEFGASRIGHGVRALEDPELVEELLRQQIPLEVCPTSNVCTAMFSGIEEHPIMEMLDRGLKVTLNTDDPSIEGTTIEKEFSLLREKAGLTAEDERLLTENAIEAAFLSEDEKAALRHLF